MQKADLVFAKIVATPTLNSWSQAYNAGSFFAVLSLARKTEKPEEEPSLNALGKEILDLLEQEYFSLEVKNLESIKQAVITTGKKVPEEVVSCLAVGSIQTFPANKHVLYVFVSGSGKVILQREETLGTIIRLERGQANILSASGFLQDKDLIILETEQFGKIISNDALKSSLDSLPPQDIAEALAPKIHEKEEGGACAIIVSYQRKEETKEEEETVLEPQEKAIKKEPLFKTLFKQYLPPLKSLLSKQASRFNTARLSHPRKMLLTISIIIAVLLLMSIFLAVKKKENAKNQALLQSTISQAQKKYAEGQALLGLNKNLARDDFLASQKVLNEGQAKFKKGSKEEKKIAELLAKVNEAISTSSNLFLVSAKQVNEGTSTLLNIKLKNKNALFVASEGKKVYLITNEGILSEKVIIKKDWDEVGGFGTYLGNFYVLDKGAGQIFKFVPTEGGFSKTNYLASGVSLDFSKAVNLSIDGSVWILLNDGTIAKFTKGKIENFTLSGLDKPFRNPVRIFTNADNNSLYILDPQNSRIVVIGKDGTYQAQYQSDILKNSSELEVVEKGKKIFVLSQEKIWEIGY